MELKKGTFLQGYVEDFGGPFQRQEWPCQHVPGSEYCLARLASRQDKAVPNMNPDGYAVWHKQSGKTVRGNLRYREARALLEKIEAAKIPPFIVDGNNVKPQEAFDALKALVTSWGALH